VTRLAGAETRVLPFALSPAQCREIFAHKGWSRVVGFFGNRLPLHSRGETLRHALESNQGDGVFFCLMLDPSEVEPQTLDAAFAYLKSTEEELASSVDSGGRLVLGTVRARAGASGPRDIVQTALWAKNMGCSHVVFDAGGSGWTGLRSDDLRAVWNRLRDPGVEAIFA